MKNNQKVRDKFAALLTFRFAFLLSQGQARFEKNLSFFENFTSQIPQKLVKGVLVDQTVL
jgi:hypothetical protein